MNIVANDTITSNAVADDQAQGASSANVADAREASAPDASESASLEATDAEKKLQAEYEAAQAKLVELAIATLDPKDMLKKYAKMGAEGLKLASKRKASFKAWAEQDYKKVCDQTEDLIRMRVPIKDIRIDTYVRIHLFVEAVRPLVPGVEKLSYYQVRNKFLHTLSFSAVELTGELKKEWLTWVRTTVEKQLGDNPLPMKELDAAIEERKKEIEAEAKARDKRTPEQVDAAEQKAAARKLTAKRTAAQSKVSNAISDAITDKLADVNDIVAVVQQAVELAGQEVRRGIVVFDAKEIDIDECKQLVAVMANAGKYAEMKYLRDNLDRMIKMADNAMITRQAI